MSFDENVEIWERGDRNHESVKNRGDRKERLCSSIALVLWSKYGKEETGIMKV
jgi:hypothetical protein